MRSSSNRSSEGAKFPSGFDWNIIFFFSDRRVIEKNTALNFMVFWLFAISDSKKKSFEKKKLKFGDDFTLQERRNVQIGIMILTTFHLRRIVFIFFFVLSSNIYIPSATIIKPADGSVFAKRV